MILLLIACLTSTLQAQDLGCYGETFSIAEKSFLTVITEKLQAIQHSGKLDLHQHIIQERMAKQALQPKPVSGIWHTTAPRTFTFDPTFVLDHDIHDHKGHILHTKGTTVNPLHQVSLIKPLLFVDGDAHMDWVKSQLRQHPNAKVILVKGKPLECEETLTHPVYFDQGGVLCRRLGLTQVPAKVTQEGDHLLIEELSFEESSFNKPQFSEVMP